MKETNLIVATVTLFLSIVVLIPLNIYQGVLLYKHVGATDLMWFVFWLNMGISVLVNLVSQFLINLFKK